MRRRASISKENGIAEERRPTAAPSARDRGSSRCEPAAATPTGRVTSEATHNATVSPAPRSKARPTRALSRM